MALVKSALVAILTQYAEQSEAAEHRFRGKPDRLYYEGLAFGYRDAIRLLDYAEEKN